MIDLVFEDNSDIRAEYITLHKKGDVLYGEAFTPLAYGGKNAVLWAAACPLFDGSGNPIGAIESIRDMVEQKK